MTYDLGRLDGPVLVFGGPYGNLAATEALVRQTKILAIPPQRTICTGDVVAYCAEPEETIRLIRNWGIQVVKGNCEEALSRRAPDCGCGFDEMSTCSTLSVEWYRHTDARVSVESRAWMATLPLSLRFALNDKSFFVVHGGTEKMNRFLFASQTQELKEELSLTRDIVVAGHCGIPFARRFGENLWLNAGVIGMPANDGTSDGWFMLLEPEERNLRVSWHRLSYDAEVTRRRMIKAGFKSGYEDTILNGLWPRVDVLPAEERARRGIPLVMKALII